jgi:hypothetical protein
MKLEFHPEAELELIELLFITSIHCQAWASGSRQRFEERLISSWTFLKLVLRSIYKSENSC